LLYVAMTRARDRLYIGGWLPKGRKQAPPNSWYALIEAAFTDATRSRLAAGETPLQKGDGESDKDNDTDEGNGAPALNPPDWLTQTAPRDAAGHAFYGNRIFSPSNLGITSSEDDAPLAGASGGNGDADAERLRAAAARGRLVHRLLEILPRYQPTQYEAAAEAYLARHSEDDDAPTVLAQVLAVLTDARLAALFSDAALAEAPIGGFLTRHDGTKLALSGQIDRLVETDDGILLVDFKTGTPPQNTTDSGPYMRQMAAYRALMRAAQPGKPVTCALVWTQNGRIETLDEALLDSALDKILNGANPLENR